MALKPGTRLVGYRINNNVDDDVEDNGEYLKVMPDGTLRRDPSYPTPSPRGFFLLGSDEALSRVPAEDTLALVKELVRSCGFMSRGGVRVIGPDGSVMNQAEIMEMPE